ncbi:MAG: [Lachnospiraceae bacterium]|nr:[FeFe] hydrogenase H-cluster maturation GTPase HydF [Lachnospiraceae bacterium]
MSLNDVPSGERKHIAFFGCTNAGKSSLVNAFTGQKLSIVSEEHGTTTDPVQKAMELQPLGPVVIIDTAGMDDKGVLGDLRMEKTLQVLRKTDIAVLVIDKTVGKSESDEKLIALFREKNIPYIIAWNKADLTAGSGGNEKPVGGADSENTAAGGSENNEITVSALNGVNIDELKELAAGMLKDLPQENELIGDLVSRGDKLVLVVPIDKAAPRGRLILPQQQVIRDALDHGAIPVVCRDSELRETLKALKEPPKMVITDSQVFAEVSKIVPPEIPLTSFSILMARYKGNLEPSLEGADRLKSLKDGDGVLISEGCTHHRQCGDIGSVKLPKWIREFTGANPTIDLSSGTEFPEDLSKYDLIIHCGACMLNPAEARARYGLARAQGVPITNYGIAIACMKGILDRSVKSIRGRLD